MKLLFGIVIIYFLINFSYANVDNEEAIKKLKPFIDECKASNHISDDDVESFFNEELSDKQGVKCFAACIMKKEGIMTDDNKINKQGYMDIFKDDPHHGKIAEETINRCVDVTHDDECEAAFEIGKCLESGEA